MTVFIGFFVIIFLATTHRELRGRNFRIRWIMLLVAITTVSMLSLRVIE